MENPRRLLRYNMTSSANKFSELYYSLRFGTCNLNRYESEIGKIDVLIIMLDVCQLLWDPINIKTFSKKTDIQGNPSFASLIRAQESIFCIFRIKIKCCLHIFNLQDQIPSPEVENILLFSDFQISKTGYSKIEF